MTPGTCRTCGFAFVMIVWGIMQRLPAAMPKPQCTDPMMPLCSRTQPILPHCSTLPTCRLLERIRSKTDEYNDL